MGKANHGRAKPMPVVKNEQSTLILHWSKDSNPRIYFQCWSIWLWGLPTMMANGPVVMIALYYSVCPNNLSSLCLSFSFYSRKPTFADSCLHFSAYYLQFSLDHNIPSIFDSLNSICRLSIPICTLRIVMPMLAC